MISRCDNRSDKAWPNYGGRGIKVCEEWYDINQFIADMGARPANHSIERTNNDLGYSSANCVWASRTAQNRNRRFTKLCLEKAEEIRRCKSKGITRKTLAKQFGVSEATIKKIWSGSYWRSLEKIAPVVADAMTKR